MSAGVFWQVHPGAAAVLTRQVLDGLAPRPGERVADLYAGAGLFTVPLARAVGPRGSVVAVERSGRACADAVRNAADLHQVSVVRSDVDPGLVADGLGKPDLVVLDPARQGAGRAVMEALVSLDPVPRRVAYVSCDPASFARDLRVALDAGWTLGQLHGLRPLPHDRARGAGGHPPAGGGAGDGLTRNDEGALVLSRCAWTDRGAAGGGRAARSRVLQRSHHHPDHPGAAAGRADPVPDLGHGLRPRGGERDRFGTGGAGHGVQAHLDRSPVLLPVRLPLRLDGALGQGAVQLGTDEAVLRLAGRHAGARRASSPAWARRRSRPPTGPWWCARTGRSCWWTPPRSHPSSASRRRARGTWPSPWLT